MVIVIIIIIIITVCCFQSGHQWLYTTTASRRIKIDRHFDDLEEVYFNTRRQSADTLITSTCCFVSIGSVTLAIALLRSWLGVWFSGN